MYSIVIPQYGADPQLRICLASIAESLKATKLQTSIEIIVVNNKATEISKKFIDQCRRENPALAIKPIYNEQNLGFGRAVNQGIIRSQGNFIVVLNNDIELDENWFNAVNEGIYNCNVKGAGAFCGKILNSRRSKIESVGLDFKPWGKAVNIGNNERDANKYSSQKVVWGATAAAVVYKKEALNKAGLFNENFFAYLEDVELNLRLIKHSYKTIYLPAAISYHYGGKTADQWTDFRQRYTSRNWWFIFKLHYSFSDFVKYFPKIILEQTKIWLGIKSWRWRFWVLKEIINILIRQK